MEVGSCGALPWLASLPPPAQPGSS
jgi:hypothetical protein